MILYGASISDNQGKFTFINVGNNKYTLQISYLGYSNYDTSFVCKSNLNLGNIILKTKNSQLEEVSVFGKTTTKVSVNNVLTIFYKELTHPKLSVKFLIRY